MTANLFDARPRKTPIQISFIQKHKAQRYSAGPCAFECSQIGGRRVPKVCRGLIREFSDGQVRLADSKGPMGR